MQPRHWSKSTAVVCAALLVVTLGSAVVLWAIKPRPFDDTGWPFTLGPHSGGDSPTTNAPECVAERKDGQGPFDWRVELLGKTYTRETWPQWWWDLI